MPISHAGLELRRDGLPLALWNRDVAAALPDGNIYGSWPAYIDIRPGERALVSGSPCKLRAPYGHRPNGSSAPHFRDMKHACMRNWAQIGVHTGCSC